MKSLNFVFALFFAIGFLTIQTANAQIQRAAISTDAGFNTSIEKLAITKDRHGRKHLNINIALEVTDQSSRALNMSFDILIYVNGKLYKKIGQNVRKNGAIYCAVTCAGECPSIFGDGVCGGCSCNYNNWFSEALGGDSDKGQIKVVLKPARGGKKDNNSRDNVKVLSPKRMSALRK